ncbi:HNH endonuclease signature motif containing protein [Myroides fluvii]|uniref:HNH endonuclease signature motif containing protein n=1 Tax=Myroides fluvii TaxID=2572594 RepID=UPI001E5A46E7|nr:HNH endonuclease [Myroides fluvii]
MYPVTGEQKNIVKIKLTGTRRFDDKLAYELAGIKKTKNYTWHHLDDYDPMDGTCTMQLVDKDVHRASIPHYGSVELIKKFLNIESY